MSRPAARVVVTAALFLTAITGIASQSPATRQAASSSPPQTGTGVIAGQLVDGSTGAPVTSAIVTLWPPNAPVPLSGDGVPIPDQVNPAVVAQALKTLVDASGRFVFHSLPPGSYALGATRNGYLQTYLGQTQPNAATAGRKLQLPDDGRVTNVVLKIWKVASISGTVVDEAGEPVVSATLRLLFAGTSPVRKFQMLASNSTDDRGAFRFGTLAPGDYLVVVPSMIASLPIETVKAFQDALAAGPEALSLMNRDVMASGGRLSSGGTRVGELLIQSSPVAGGLISPVIVREDGRPWVYPATYYPAARTISAATTVTVRSGETRTGVNIAVHPVPAVKVAGIVIGSAGPVPNMTVSFVPMGMEDKPTSPYTAPEVGQAITARDGTFTGLLPAGSYTASVLRVQSGGPDFVPARGAPPPPPIPPEPVLWGKTKFSADSSRADGITIRLAEGMTVSGRVEYEPGVATAPLPAALQRMRVLVRPAEGTSGVRPSDSPLSADRAFRTRGFPPGSYTVGVGPPQPGWTLKSITGAGRDLTLDPLEISSADVEGIVVTFTDTAGEVSGTVARTEAGDVYVMLVPVDPRVSPQSNLRRMRVAASGDNTFRFSGVLPGDYRIAAVDANPSFESTPRVSSWLTRGTVLTLGEREKRSVALTVIK